MPTVENEPRFTREYALRTARTEDTVKALTDATAGCYVVTTESGSCYLLDLDRRIVRRTPGSDSVGVLGLRRDLEEVVLVEIVSCELGVPMLLLIDLGLADVIVTSRASTPVIRIVSTTIPEGP